MQLKTIKLKGKDYVQVNERVSYFNETYKQGMITSEPTFKDNTVYFKATVFPDAKDKERFFTGHSFGELGKEKALEKLETVSVGRALAFMGIGIIESLASSDEMSNFYAKSETEKLGFCSVCGEQGIKAKRKNGTIFTTCPNWKLHQDNKEKFEITFDDRTKEEVDFQKSLDNIK
jgi:hypothetical protein